MIVDLRVLPLFINVGNTPILQSFTAEVFIKNNLRRPALIKSDYKCVIYHLVSLFLLYIISASSFSVRFGLGLLS
jgi:hypothetical protein